MRKPGWLLSPSFCLDAITLSFNIFIHSLLFSFISQLILFIICPYLWAWQSILHSASADRWKNDPCLTLPSITSFLPSSLHSSWSPSETRLTAWYISSSHSNASSSHPHDRAFSPQCTLFSLAWSMSLSCNNWGWDKGEGTFYKTIEDSIRSQNTHCHSSPFIPSSPSQIYLALSGCIFLQTLYDTFLSPCSSHPPPHFTAVPRGNYTLTQNTEPNVYPVLLMITVRPTCMEADSEFKADSFSTQQVTLPAPITSLHDMPELSGKQG